MAKLLFTVWPFPGHVNPCVGLARALRARGHEVGFYTGVTARETVEGEGFRYFPFENLAGRLRSLVGEISGADHASLYLRLTERYTVAGERNPLARLRRITAMYVEWILGSVPEQVSDLEALIESWAADAVITDPFMWGPILVLHEKQLAPVVVFSFFAGCLLPGPDAPPAGFGLPRPRSWSARQLMRLVEVGQKFLTRSIRREANRIRQEYGLAPLRSTVVEYTGRLPLHLVSTVPEFDYQRLDLPPSVYYVGPCLWDKPSRQAVAPWIAELPQSRPVVYVTEGTSQVRDPVLLRSAAHGLAGLPIQVIMTTGTQRDPAKLALGRSSPNVRVERWVPHSDLFPKLDLIVTNGGSNTVRAGLQAGVPFVVVPMEWDQLENAQRLVEAGAGCRIPLGTCNPKRLRAAVEKVLGDPSFTQNARRLSSSFARYGEGERAVELLESLCQRRAASARSHPESLQGARTH